DQHDGEVVEIGDERLHRARSYPGSPRCASQRPSPTQRRPSAAGSVTDSARKSAPRTAAVNGLSARKTVTSVAGALPSAQSQRKYPMPLPTPMKTIAAQPLRLKCGQPAKNPSRAASTARNTTDASIASALTGTVGYRRTYGRYSTLHA